MAEARGRPMWLRCRSRRLIRALEAECEQSLNVGNVSGALDTLQVLSDRFRWHSLAEKLLFYRSNRPDSIALEIELLQGISLSTCFRKHHRFYAEVSLAYRACVCEDIALASEVQRRLEREVFDLEADSGTITCRRRNRENRLKMLISSNAALMHLALLKNDHLSLIDIGFRSSALLNKIDFDNVPADVSLRMISNFTRCLVLNAPRSNQCVVADLIVLVNEAKRQRHSNSRAQEDHLSFVKTILNAVDLETVPAILTIDTPRLRVAFAAYWQNGSAAVSS